ncbi:MAG: alanine racemase [Chlamydia sp.]
MDPFSLALWPLYRALCPDRLEAFIDDVTIDSRIVSSSQSLFVALSGNRNDGHNYIENAFNNGAKYALVLADWIQPPHILEEQLIRTDNTLSALQDLAKCIRTIRGANTTVVAIGGCAGKTMLKDLLLHILKDEKEVYFSPESYNSQIGVALSLIHLPEKCHLAFIEVAANQSHEMKRLISMVQPTHSIIINFFRYRYGIEQVKSSVIEQLIELIEATQSWSLIEKNEYIPPTLLNNTSLFFWNTDSNTLPSTRFSSIEHGKLMLKCSLPGESEISIRLNSNHLFMVEQVQIALRTCTLLWEKFQISFQDIVQKLDNYRPQTIRTEVWKNSFGTTYINSTYSHKSLSLFSSLEELSTFLEPISSLPIKKARALILGEFHRFSLDEKQKRRIVDLFSFLGISSIAFWPCESLNSFDIEYAEKSGISFFSCNSPEEAIQIIGNHDQFNSIIFKGVQKLALDWLFHLLEESIPQTYLCVNLAAIRHNIDLLRRVLGPATRLMFMIKALAYGTDDIRLAYFLRGCGIDILGVSYIDEGVKMRKNGVQQNIFILNAMPHEMQKACTWNLEIGIESHKQLYAAKEAVKTHRKIDANYRLKVHLHIDTGMKRFGCTPEEAVALGQAIYEAAEYFQFEGLFTHFCSSDDPKQDEYTLFQGELLNSIYRELKALGIEPQHIHAANSAAALRFQLPYCSMARIGLAAYGIYPSSAVKEKVPSMQPAISLVTKIAGIAYAKKNDTVGYGRKYVIKSDTALIATIPIGYYDGMHRIYSGKSELLIRGYRAPIIGNICMDYLMVDVSHIPYVSVGDSVLIFGEDEMGKTIPIEEYAERGGSISHELMTCLGPRVQRIFIYDESLRSR